MFELQQLRNCNKGQKPNQQGKDSIIAEQLCTETADRRDETVAVFRSKGADFHLTPVSQSLSFRKLEKFGHGGRPF
ncbi:MAG: hypothetical protein WB420_08930 [Bradyrhizobium sp.]